MRTVTKFSIKPARKWVPTLRLTVEFTGILLMISSLALLFSFQRYAPTLTTRLLRMKECKTKQICPGLRSASKLDAATQVHGPRAVDIPMAGRHQAAQVQK